MRSMLLTPTSSSWLGDLAHALAADGVGAHESDVRQVVDAARARGLGPTLARLVADTDAPPVARARAFGRLAELLVTDAAIDESARSVDPLLARRAC